MAGIRRVLTAIGVALVAAGILLATIPMTFIEDTFGMEPDGGNGMLELTIVLALLVIGIALIVRSIGVRRRITRAMPRTDGH